MRLRIEVTAHEPLSSPIVGFFLKDRLGQVLFGENTYLTYQHAPIAVAAGESFTATFEFTMPILPQGHYSFDVATAEGTYLDHRQADWVHDAFVLGSHSSSVSTGLVGIPFRDIRIEAGGSS